MRIIFSIIVIIAFIVESFGERSEKDNNVVGGRIKEGGSGFFCIVNSGGVDNERPLLLAGQQLEGILMAEVRVTKGTWNLKEASIALDKIGANAAVFVVHDAELPISLIALEAKWAVVNAKGQSEEVVKKEILRVSTILLGSCYSQYKGSVMRPAFSADDLEKKVGDSLTIDVIVPLLNGFQNLGIKPYSYVELEPKKSQLKK